jgi:CRISPR-associated exonuclease Cas4
VEENFRTKVQAGFIYLVPTQEVVSVELTERLRDKTLAMLTEIRSMIREGMLPTPSPVRARCEDCEFRNYCGDVF